MVCSPTESGQEAIRLERWANKAVSPIWLTARGYKAKLSVKCKWLSIGWLWESFIIFRSRDGDGKNALHNASKLSAQTLMSAYWFAWGREMVQTGKLNLGWQLHESIGVKLHLYIELWKVQSIHMFTWYGNTCFFDPYVEIFTGGDPARSWESCFISPGSPNSHHHLFLSS